MVNRRYKSTPWSTFGCVFCAAVKSFRKMVHFITSVEYEQNVILLPEYVLINYIYGERCIGHAHFGNAEFRGFRQKSISIALWQVDDVSMIEHWTRKEDEKRSIGVDTYERMWTGMDFWGVRACEMFCSFMLGFHCSRLPGSGVLFCVLWPKLWKTGNSNVIWDSPGFIVPLIRSQDKAISGYLLSSLNENESCKLTVRWNMEFHSVTCKSLFVETKVEVEWYPAVNQ